MRKLKLREVSDLPNIPGLVTCRPSALSDGKVFALNCSVIKLWVHPGDQGGLLLS